jgi:hypothetical protein
MRYFIPGLMGLFACVNSYGQTVTWASETVPAKEVNLYTGLSFPGVSQGKYIVNESEGGGLTFNRKWSDYLKYVDISTLKVLKEQPLADLASKLPGKEKDYLNSSNFVLGSRSFSFFIKTKDKKQLQVFSAVQTLEGQILREASPLFDVELSKGDKSGSNFYQSLMAAMHVLVNPSYDGKTILAAYISNVIDKDFATMTVKEFDLSLNETGAASMKIPFKSVQHTIKTIFGATNSGNPIDAYLLDVKKDAEGNAYVAIYSANPGDSKDLNMASIAQVSLKNPAKNVLFHEEFGKQSATNAKLSQKQDGHIFVSILGNAGERANDYTYDLVNTAFIGQFDDSGQLKKISSGPLANEFMYHFEKEKRVNKDGYVNGLTVADILPASKGYYMIWEQKWSDTKVNYTGSQTATTYRYDNAVVQYFDGQNKVRWTKPIFKRQAMSDKINDVYAGLHVIVANDELIVIYPDDSKNAGKTIEDREVELFSVVKFGGKDLAGIFFNRFTSEGNLTRQYVHWPEHRVGYALDLNSLAYLGNHEFIGTVRKIKQGVFMLKSEDYAFFRLKY